MRIVPTQRAAAEGRQPDDDQQSCQAVLTPTHPINLAPPLCVPSLSDIVRVLKDINLNVVSAEVDTIGRNAFDRFNVT